MSKWDVTYWETPYGLRIKRFEAYDLFGLVQLLYTIQHNSIVKVERVPDQG